MPLSPARIRLLLVEDDFDVAAGLGAYLDARGVTVQYACTASAARAVLTEQTVDLVVLDVRLPDGDGVALCHDLKARGPIVGSDWACPSCNASSIAPAGSCRSVRNPEPCTSD